MESAKLARLIGPTLVVMSVTESINYKIWTENTAPCLYINGAILFAVGTAIVEHHNIWSLRWPVLVTLVGWGSMALGLVRMVSPVQALRAAKLADGHVVMLAPALTLVVGSWLSFRGFMHR
ncbi:hypothetical protein BX600DRAFT_163270 [Xylariales sp. PMI_506]|nr:hypothetical protein BX600DRAFT_163270 [Xylariales sp. PMI_506]